MKGIITRGRMTAVLCILAILALLGGANAAFACGGPTTPVTTPPFVLVIGDTATATTTVTATSSFYPAIPDVGQLAEWDMQMVVTEPNQVPVTIDAWANHGHHGIDASIGGNLFVSWVEKSYDNDADNASLPSGLSIPALSGTLSFKTIVVGGQDELVPDYWDAFTAQHGTSCAGNMVKSIGQYVSVSGADWGMSGEIDSSGYAVTTSSGNVMTDWSGFNTNGTPFVSFQAGGTTATRGIQQYGNVLMGTSC